jgi:hypothetical protein
MRFSEVSLQNAFEYTINPYITCRLYIKPDAWGSMSVVLCVCSFRRRTIVNQTLKFPF